jgi:hypothetical protein
VEFSWSEYNDYLVYYFTRASEHLTTEFPFNIFQTNSGPSPPQPQYYRIITIATSSQDTAHPLRERPWDSERLLLTASPGNQITLPHSREWRVGWTPQYIISLWRCKQTRLSKTYLAVIQVDWSVSHSVNQSNCQSASPSANLLVGWFISSSDSYFVRCYLLLLSQ